MKIFGNKKITIRNLIKSDIKQAKKFQDFINSLAKEDAKILINEKTSLKDEIIFLDNILKTTKRRNKVFLLAESDGNVVGTVSVELDKFRRNHIGKFGIAIRVGYRGMGLGKYLMTEIITLAKKELKPKPKRL